MILKMILFQAIVVGIIGYILGTGVTLLWGFAIKNTTLTFEFPGALLLFTGSRYCHYMCVYRLFKHEKSF